MTYSSVFHLAADLIRKHNVVCVLIGGFAINFYKIQRNTQDTDFLITKEDFSKVRIFLEQEGYQMVSNHENFAQFEDKEHRLMDIDFMFVDSQTINKIFNAGQKMKIVGQEFTVPSLEHLIALKMHAIKYNQKIRLFKDLPDIIGLIKANQLNVKEDKFKQLCLKHGNEQIYKHILEACT